MTPTNELRFVEREVRIHPADCLLPSIRTIRILQQKWAHFNDADYHSLETNVTEWRDVPCVKEET